jgi:hypothetical protein
MKSIPIVTPPKTYHVGELVMTRRHHPDELKGRCNFCDSQDEQVGTERSNLEGIILERSYGKTKNYYFFCLDCARKIGKLAEDLAR